MLKWIMNMMSGSEKRPREKKEHRNNTGKQNRERTASYGKRYHGLGIHAAALVCVLAVGCLAFTGCQDEGDGKKKIKDLEFTVVSEKEIPDALQEMIMQKKENSFKLTYADGQDMYIVVGKGPQDGGGFSIVVKELYLTENSIVFKTELIGPEKGEKAGTAKSYPVLIVKTEFCEAPVIFQ